jgi:hypothetical protein
MRAWIICGTVVLVSVASSADASQWCAQKEVICNAQNRASGIFPGNCASFRQHCDETGFWQSRAYFAVDPTRRKALKPR